MLLPRFQLRTGLKALAIAAVLLMAVRGAFNGEVWAFGMAIGLVSLVLLFLVHAALFALAMLLTPRSSKRVGEGGKR